MPTKCAVTQGGARRSNIDSKELPEYSSPRPGWEKSKIRESLQKTDIRLSINVGGPIQSRRGHLVAPETTGLIDLALRRDAAPFVPKPASNQDCEAGRGASTGSVRSKLPASRCAR